MSAPRWPVTILTGMLGSGKTTVVRQLLQDPAMRGTAVLINEIGEIGLDHHLVERVDGETILMKSGCLCCTLRADLPQTLASLRRRWVADGRFDLRRIVVETTGLARPIPILRELASNPLICADFPLAAVITTVDGLHGAKQMWRPEVREQIGVADLLLLTKLDIVSSGEVIQIRDAVAEINPRAPLHEVINGHASVDLASLLVSQSPVQMLTWDSISPQPANPPFEAPPHHHVHGITLAATRSAPIPWSQLESFIGALLAEGAPGLLRFKGIFNVAELDSPVVLQSVQSVLYDASTLESWPDDDVRSRFVMIFEESSKRPYYVDLLANSPLDWIIAGDS